MAAPGPGTLFPASSLRTEDGRAAPRAARETLYAVFHTECPTSELCWPYLERLRRIGDGGGLPVVGVSQDDPSETAAFLARLGVSAPVLYDPPPWKASQALGLSSVPALARVGADGRVQEIVVGFQKARLDGLATRAAELSGRPAGSLFGPNENVPAVRPG
ncbi:MAG TPA: TlpA disulfide reductase family protein [Thermoanaerobaculia bacterium]|nr:TlpA disulfide reductase family protein [Thermoanaerobaculia bacterium]